MVERTWSNGEKKIARRAFDRAMERELAAMLASIRERVERITEPYEMWALHDYLSAKRREIDNKYDFRYSQLIWVFGRLLREGWLREDDLQGLDEQKIASILTHSVYLPEFSRRTRLRLAGRASGSALPAADQTCGNHSVSLFPLGDPGVLAVRVFSQPSEKRTGVPG